MPLPLTALLAGRRGHFEMESGYHTDQWFELDRLFTDRERLRPFVRDLAQQLAVHRPEVICGPETGGAILAVMIAEELHLPAVPAARFEPPDARGFFPIKYQIPAAHRAAVRHQRVALVDDAISAGSAIRGSHADLLGADARPVAVGALFVFGDDALHFAAAQNLGLEAIARLPSNLWPPDACPLCQARTPLEKISDVI